MWDVWKEIDRQIQDSLGDSFELLDDTSKVIARSLVFEYTSVEHLVSQYSSKARSGNWYDYSGIALKLATVVERSINIRLFYNWWLQCKQAFHGDEGKKKIEEIKRGLDRDEIEAILAESLSRPHYSWFNLNETARILSGFSEQLSDTSLHKYLLDYISKRSGSAWLRSNLKEKLEKLKVDRNIAAHTEIITEKTCRDAYREILMGPKPWLKKLLESLAEKKQSARVLSSENQLENLSKETTLYSGSDLISEEEVVPEQDAPVEAEPPVDEPVEETPEEKPTPQESVVDLASEEEPKSTGEKDPERKGRRNKRKKKKAQNRGKRKH